MMIYEAVRDVRVWSGGVRDSCMCDDPLIVGSPTLLT